VLCSDTEQAHSAYRTPHVCPLQSATWYSVMPLSSGRKTSSIKMAQLSTFGRSSQQLKHLIVEQRPVDRGTKTPHSDLDFFFALP